MIKRLPIWLKENGKAVNRKSGHIDLEIVNVPVSSYHGILCGIYSKIAAMHFNVNTRQHTNQEKAVAFFSLCCIMSNE